MNPRFPIYIISKGRWERRQTIKTMEFMNCPYKVFVEPSEYSEYTQVVSKENIIKLPDNFSEMGQGSIPVRNFVWDYSIENNDKRHWILDDNLESVERFNNNLKVKCKTPTPFYIIEDFALRYKNIAQAGMHYAIFCPANEARPPIQFNTRVYSNILIKNDIPFRWRGKYNEDTDLSLRILKAGFCTVLFRAFLVGKRATQTQKGGNQDIYDETKKRLEFAESLRDQHPDVVKVVKRFNRWHHKVDYKPFKKNNLIRNNTEQAVGVNNYGLTRVLRDI